MEAPGYDPSVSTHKASSISSTSTASTWDYPLSNFSGNEETLDESIIQNASGFEDYHFGPAIERISFPELEMTNDYSLSKGKQQNSSNHVSSEREERFFANFVTASTTAEENGLPELVSPLTSSSAAYYIQDTKQQSENHEARIPEKERDNHEAEKAFNVENDSINKTDLFSHISPYVEPIVDDNQDASTNSRKKRSACAISKHSDRPIHPKSATTEVISKSQPETLSNSKRSKPSKDGLTDDEKRANHIVSEQKRRNAIRTGFKDLTEIVPTLKNINNSKSTILFKAVEYIRYLDKRNRGLKEKTSSLRVRMGVEERYRSSSSRALNRYNSNPAENYIARDNYSNQSNYGVSNNNQLHHLPANTVSALIAHKNQQRQLELLQEQLRAQQQLLAKHNIVPDMPAATLPDSSVSNNNNNSSSSRNTNISLGSRNSLDSHMRPHFAYAYHQQQQQQHHHRPTQYNSISIPSTHNDDDNESLHRMMKGKFIQSNTAALIVPQDEDDGPWRPSDITEISNQRNSHRM